MRDYPGGIIAWCDSGSALPLSEGTTLACLYSVSQGLFQVFDHIVSARTRADLEKAPPKERCGSEWHSNLNGYDLGLWPGPDSDPDIAETYQTPPLGHCAIIFRSNVLPAKQSTHTLVDWCSHFISDAAITSSASAVGSISVGKWHRWKACIMGAFGYSARFVTQINDEPYPMRGRWCPQMLEVPWLNASMRRASHDVCHNSSAEREMTISQGADGKTTWTGPLDGHLFY